jgi:hypothetical protein
MADDLTGLGARGFERMCQALASYVLGPGVQVFGDGPDGGREASFDGRLSYPNAEGPWDGYGVLQAKYKEKVTASGQDTAWFLGRVKAEMNAWTNPNKRRVRDGRLPEYLIFATNIALSAVPGGGGKDRVDDLIRGYLGTLPVKDWRIWDATQITTLGLLPECAPRVCRVDHLERGHRHDVRPTHLPGPSQRRCRDTPDADPARPAGQRGGLPAGRPERGQVREYVLGAVQDILGRGDVEVCEYGLDCRREFGSPLPSTVGRGVGGRTECRRSRGRRAHPPSQRSRHPATRWRGSTYLGWTSTGPGWTSAGSGGGRRAERPAIRSRPLPEVREGGPGRQLLRLEVAPVPGEPGARPVGAMLTHHDPQSEVGQH